MSEPPTKFNSAYEAHYRLVSVHEADLHRWTAWCKAAGCGWHRTEYSAEQVNDVALTHCQKEHVQ